MRKVKKIARYIVELILTISIVTFILIHSISSKIFNEKHILDLFNKTEYYAKTYELLESNFEKYIQQSGLDEQVLKNIVTKEDIENDTKKIIISIFDGLHEEVNTDEIKGRLNNNINRFIKENNISKISNESIDEFINKICDEYRYTISNSNYEEQINDVYTKTTKYVSIIKRISIISIGICIILIVLLNLKRIYRVLTNIGISFFASGILLFILNIFINLNVKINYISILNDNISDIIRIALNEILRGITINSLMLITIGLILFIIANIISEKLNEKSKKIKEHEI